MGAFEIIFWGAIGISVYTYLFYPLILHFIARLIKPKKVKVEIYPYVTTVTIIIAAYDKEKAIEKRIQNLLSLCYPKDKVEIIVASDGSTDRTVEKTRQFEEYGVKTLEFFKNRGRAAVHNDSLKIAKSDIVIFTDADTTFEKDFISKVISPFSDPNVGCVVGNLIYKSKGGCIAEMESLYYNKWELNLKELESKLGILANGTGACMAIRKKLFKWLDPTDDIDTTTVIDIVFQGYRVVFAKDAIAYDIPPHSIKSEFDYRIRGTSQTLMILLRRIPIKRYFRRPLLSWSLLSHRILRYLTPYFMTTILISNIFLLKEGLLYQIFFGMQVFFYIFAIFGWLGEYSKIKISIASTAFSFCVAMLGIMIGVAKGITGKAPASYKMQD